jgi:hypothetical protein
MTALDSNGNLLPHKYVRTKVWFGWTCHVPLCSYAPDAPIHDVVERDREYEGRFLAYVEGLADHFGASDPTFTERVLGRVNGAGVRNYGDDSFLSDSRDLVQELREECQDACAYAMFEIERRRIVSGDESEDDDLFHHLCLAAAHAAVADYHASQAQRYNRR